MFYYDSTMIILLPALLISAWAQMRINSTYEKYSRIRSGSGYTGAQVARRLLDKHGLYDVPIELVRGKLTDHYDPRSRVMRLSSEVYHGTSVAAIGIAAHETGHAYQHEERYSPLVIRNTIVPIVNLGSNLSWIIFFFGMILSIPSLLNVGILLFLGVVVFQLITLPVEFNASSRAMDVLESSGILYDEEITGARRVLKAAAMTYIAAAIASIAQLLRLIALSNRRRD